MEHHEIFDVLDTAKIQQIVNAGSASSQSVASALPCIHTCAWWPLLQNLIIRIYGVIASSRNCAIHTVVIHTHQITTIAKYAKNQLA